MKLQQYIISSLLSALALASNSKKLSGPPGRIVGGVEVSPPFKYNWMVSIHKNGSHYCGGSLYNGNTVITAAHCTVGIDSDFEVLVHRHDLSQPEASEHGRRYKVIKRTNHPKFNGNDTSNDTSNDVAIWKLENSDSTRTKLTLDNGKFGSAKTTLFTTMGWGRTAPGGQKSNILLEVKVPTFDNATCVKNYADFGAKVNTDYQICAGLPEGGKDACNADSGGPLFVIKDNKPILAGIVSWGIGCAGKGFPGIYSRVSVLNEWILANLN